MQGHPGLMRARGVIVRGTEVLPEQDFYRVELGHWVEAREPVSDGRARCKHRNVP